MESYENRFQLGCKMIDDLRAMAIFATVAETGSFSAAGRQLRLATSGVSQHVTKLEDRLGVTLLYRSTRALSLTAEGERLLEHARRMMAAAEDGLDSITDVSGEPAGSLTVTLPAILVDSPYEQAIWDFVARHRGVEMTVRYLDRSLDLISDGIDLALRMGSLPDSALQSRRLGSFSRVLVCSPACMRDLPVIETPADLQRAGFIEMQGMPEQMTLIKGDQQETLSTGHSRVRVDNFAALRAALRAGLGIQRLPRTAAEADLHAGTLVQVLPDWRLPDLGVYCLWPDSSRRASLTRMLVQHIVSFD